MRYSILCTIAGALLLLASCSEHEVKDFQVEKPESLVEREKLDSYEALNTYSSNLFKVGAFTSIADYAKMDMQSRILDNNFDELILRDNVGDMSHSTLIDNTGVLNADNLTGFLQTITDKGFSLFGSPLCWNEKQNALYLNAILAPSTKEAENNLLDIAELKKGSFSGWTLTTPTGKNANISVKSAAGVRDEGITVVSDVEYYAWEYNLASPKIQIDPTKQYYLAFYVKTNAAGRIRIYFDKTTYNYPKEGLVEITPDVWQYVTIQVPGFKTGTEYFQFFIDFGYLKTTYNIDVTSFTLKEGISDPNDKSLLVERNAEEQAVIIDEALDSYISQLMSVCAPTVQSWNAISEPLDTNPPYDLRSGKDKNLANDEFYWSDYLGELYLSSTISAARKYYTENGGTASDLKLFVQETGLLDNNEKCDALIRFINKNETSKGVTVDGISTDLRIVCGLTSIESIRSLFSKLAGTGKQVRIANIEMSYRVGGESTNTPVGSLTSEQQLELADFMKDLVKAYLNEVPAVQRGGITFGNVIDNTYSGLWSSTFNRNFLYQGFVEGVSGN